MLNVNFTFKKLIVIYSLFDWHAVWHRREEVKSEIFVALTDVSNYQSCQDILQVYDMCWGNVKSNFERCQNWQFFSLTGVAKMFDRCNIFIIS